MSTYQLTSAESIRKKTVNNPEIKEHVKNILKDIDENIAEVSGRDSKIRIVLTKDFLIQGLSVKDAQRIIYYKVVKEITDKGYDLTIDTINNKTLSITIPDIMYHRRNYATGQGTEMGMTFTASGQSKFIGTSNVEYYDLYEDANYVTTPKVVGKVLPQLKMVVIHDDEIVAAMSYKSNRNWTLPQLSAQLITATGGTSAGLLEINKTMYITYALDNTSGTGLTETLPCQSYIKITNTTSSTKDVGFKINDIDQLPYMRKVESLSYDGLGFYATNFKVLYQIVDEINTRPDPNAWKAYDFTSTGLTTNVGETIDPLLLENQNP